MESNVNDPVSWQLAVNVTSVDDPAGPVGTVTVPVVAKAPASLEAVEGTLTRALGAWSIASVALGSAVAVAGRTMQRPGLLAFGRQTAAWGAVDGVIAGVGALSRRRRGELTATRRSAKSRTLRRVLVANAVADVGYVVGGAAIVIRDVRGRPTFGIRREDGLAVVSQGLFLLLLDVSQAHRLSPRDYAS